MKAVYIILSLLYLSFSAMAQSKPPHLNHIALSVTNLAKSSAFYKTVIGLDTIPEPFHDGRHVWLAIGGGAQLHLIQNTPPLLVPDKNTHLCFSVSNFTELMAVLIQKGISYEDWPGKTGVVTTRPDGIHQAYMKDPDGYWVEINDNY